MYTHDYRATGYSFRLYSGKDALGRLPDEIVRRRAQRAFIVCGRTVSRKTALINRLRALLGARLAGVFDEVEQVGEAEHERFVIDVDKYTERLRKKIAG